MKEDFSCFFFVFVLLLKLHLFFLFILVIKAYALNAEPDMLAPQQGSFEVVNANDPHGQVLRQTVLQTPVAWCSQTLLYNSSLVILGRINW